MSTSDPHIFEYAGRDLEAMGFARNYHAWIRDEFVQVARGDIAEIGAGDGAFSELLLELRPRSLTLFEPSGAMHELQRQRLPEVAAIRRVNSTFSGSSSAYIEAFDCMFYVNVLEHIPDDRSELSLAFAALRPGGSICVFVPALQWLMSDFDPSIGHHRRYTRHSLRQKLRDAGFVIQRDHYLDGLDIVPWLLFMKLGRGGLDARAVSTYDRLIIPILRAIETRVRPLIGKNVLAITSKAS